MKKSLDSLSPIELKPNFQNSYAASKPYYQYGGANK